MSERVFNGHYVPRNTGPDALEQYGMAHDLRIARAAEQPPSEPSPLTVEAVAPHGALAKVLREHGYIERWSGNEATCACRQWTESVQRKPYTTYSQHLADAVFASGVLTNRDDVIREAKAEAWAEAHDLVCPQGPVCSAHRPPYGLSKGAE